MHHGTQSQMDWQLWSSKSKKVEHWHGSVTGPQTGGEPCIEHWMKTLEKFTSHYYVRRFNCLSYFGSLLGHKNWRFSGLLQSGAGQVFGWSIGGTSCGRIGGDGCLWATQGWQGRPGLQVQQRPCESVNVNVSSWAKPEATKQPKRTATVNADFLH